MALVPARQLLFSEIYNGLISSGSG